MVCNVAGPNTTEVPPRKATSAPPGTKLQNRGIMPQQWADDHVGPTATMDEYLVCSFPVLITSIIVIIIRVLTRRIRIRTIAIVTLIIIIATIMLRLILIKILIMIIIMIMLY